VQRDARVPCEPDEHEYRYVGQGDAREDCEQPKVVCCVLCGYTLSLRCSASARSRCGPCSTTYRRRVRRVFESGWTDRPTERVYFVTLTAPSEKGGHFMPSGDLCPCTPLEGINLAQWHATVGKRWNLFITDLRRQFGDVQYAKAAEVQEERGAVHFHALLRCDAVLSVAMVRQLAIKHGFGHEVDVQLVPASTDAARAAGYAAKYASKSADARQEVDWLDLRTGEVLRGWPRLRVWTASRAWGLSMRAVKAAQAAWARAAAESAGASATPDPAAADAGGGGPLDSKPQSYADGPGSGTCGNAR
jgi:hypothetical protein